MSHSNADGRLQHCYLQNRSNISCFFLRFSQKSQSLLVLVMRGVSFINLKPNFTRDVMFFYYTDYRKTGVKLPVVQGWITVFFPPNLSEKGRGFWFPILTSQQCSFVCLVCSRIPIIVTSNFLPKVVTLQNSFAMA